VLYKDIWDIGEYQKERKREVKRKKERKGDLKSTKNTVITKK